MPTYEISVGGKTYEVNSQQPLTDAQAYAAIQSQVPSPEKTYRAPAVPQEELDRRAAKMALEGTPDWQQELINIGAGMMRPVRGVGQLLGLVSETDVENARAADKALAEASPYGAEQFLGEILPGMAVGGGIGKGVQVGVQAISRALPRAAAALGGTAGRLGQAALTGGAESALTQGTGAGESRARNAAIGAAFGGGAQAVGGGLGRVATGLVRPSAHAEALMRRGIVPTIGQAADEGTKAGGILKRMEESSQSVPVIGDIITRARQRASKEAMEDIISQTLPPKAPRAVVAGKTGNEAIQATADAYKSAYSDVLRGTKVQPDFKTISSMQAAINDPATALTPAQRRTITRYLNETIGDKIVDKVTGKLQPVDGEMYQRIKSDLGAQARKWAGSSSAQERAMGEAYRDVGNAWRQIYSPASVGPEKAAALDALDAQYAKFKRVQEAAGTARAATKEGEFTPRELMGAIRRLEPRKGKFAGGESLLQTEAAQMANVLGKAVPDSGTPTRMLTNALLLGPAAAFGMLPAVIKGGLTAGAAYTRPGQKALLGGNQWQRDLRQRLQSFQRQYPGVLPGAAQSLQED